MRILYFVQYFNLPHEPGGSRAYQFARAWVRSGHDVTVVTGAVNHKTLRVDERFRGRLVSEEDIEGIRLLRVWSYAGIRGSFRKRLWNFLSFALFASILGVLRGGRTDLVYASSTPLTVGVPGWVSAFFRRVPFCFEIRDLWPQSAIAAGVLRRGALVTRASGTLASWLYRRASRIIAVTRGIREGLIAEGTPAGKVVFVPNGVDDWMIDRMDIDRMDIARMDAVRVPGISALDGFRLVYCGAHGTWNGLGQILDAAAILSGDPSIRIEFIGDGDASAALRERARQESLTQVRFHGAMSKTDAFDRMRAASACVVVTWNHPFQRMILANKIFDYMAASRPVIVAAEGEMAELVRDAGCGLVVPPEDPLALAGAIRAMADMDERERERMGHRGRSYILERYQREDLAMGLLHELASVAGIEIPREAEPQVRPRGAGRAV